MALLKDNILKKDTKYIARILRLIERQDKQTLRELEILYPYTGKSHIIGITGPPGAGKSTIISGLISEVRKKGKTVAVIAVDPSSPYSGGSLLGDRIRMQKYSLDKGVFIKSVSTAGWHGGISRITTKLITVMDAAGFDTIIVETVGVGQAELEIRNLVHTAVVVLTGGMGDYIQVIKAGILEIADIFVINKIDKDEALDLEANLKNLDVRPGGQDAEEDIWTIPVIMVQATVNKGIRELTESIFLHKDYLVKTDGFDRLSRSRYKDELRQLILDRFTGLLDKKLEDDPGLKRLFGKGNNSKLYDLAGEIFQELLKGKQDI